MLINVLIIEKVNMMEDFKYQLYQKLLNSCYLTILKMKIKKEYYWK